MRKRLAVTLAVTLMLSMLAPMMSMAESNNNELGYDRTRKIAAEKAALLTETYGITSVQYALIDNGNIVVSGHSGTNDKEGNTGLTADTMYGVGSTSKMFAAAAVMKLVDEGKVNLDAPVASYISDFKMKDDRYKRITPRMLLNHSSGLGGATLGNAMLFDDNDTHAHDALLEQLAVQSLKADPGAFSVYCNDSFTLAEILVERVSGMDFTSFIHKYFTAPLGMTNTKTPLEQIDPSRMAGLYYPTYEGQLPRDTVNVIGTGGIYSTAEDIVSFAKIFTGQADGILSDKSLKAMEQEEYKRGMWPKDADSSVGFGLGWDSVNMFPFSDYGIKALTKGGDTILYHSSLVVLPEHNMAAAVLSSGGDSMTDQLLANEMLLSALQEKGVIKERKPAKSHGVPVKANMPQEVAKNAGIYGAFNQLAKIEVSADGELSVSMIMLPEYPVAKYTYTADGSFVNADGSEKASFVTEDNGRTYLWVRTYSALPGLGQTALSQYTAEKLEANPLSADVAAAWANREGKKYYAVNEKYTSMWYYISMPSIQVSTVTDASGYWANKKIKGADKAVSELQIPFLGSRDAMEHNFYTKKGIEYLDVAGSLYVREEAVKQLYAGKQSSVTVQADGYAKWYSIPAAAAGKTMLVDMPETGAFVVYDQKGACVNDTVVSGKNEIVLPQSGTVVFAGEAGAKFGISLK
ncbi:beta-lactamase family protein [Paenibacillus sp. MER TA 81-3]|uniref:serine hydrolase domain-containing protein n=1 Tax=Paenibacillus sp. MER TA 81-3 TaxID=2939573 RepID=UPI00203F3CCF|nr:serine hydrolase domain-containing protein [Paenibacillus sp. MER TA 81-3]MCM3340531.1 beta-lactamase family protein [Paenibacillus sp. MER TA 81-3]